MHEDTSGCHVKLSFTRVGQAVVHRQTMTGDLILCATGHAPCLVVSLAMAQKKHETPLRPIHAPVKNETKIRIRARTASSHTPPVLLSIVLRHSSPFLHLENSDLVSVTERLLWHVL